ncbi:retroviral-like aspartic protease family protein [Flavobacteriaceae bacterium]|nr:retroviral-like aspartic protease family protein [Flavobacteriaceae bacterium]
MKTPPVSLSEFLKHKSYFKIKMHLIASNHFKILLNVNGVKGLFILDTGASTTFIDIKLEERFKLRSEPSIVKASGAGPDKIDTLLSKNNTIKIGGWMKSHFPIALIDLSYVNNAFDSIATAPVDGIIGADILKKGCAVIDYEKKYLYLKQSYQKIPPKRDL